MRTLNRPTALLTHWCDDCDGPAAVTYCAMNDERTCKACHAWIECPCEEGDYA
jgi:hypothetical protein